MSDLPLEHLSASSINLFLRCPRSWQEQYIRGIKGPANSPLVLGSAVHLALSRMLKGEDPGHYFQDAVEDYKDGIVWKDSRESLENLASAMVYHYYERVGKYLDVVETEREFSLEIPGVDIPVIGFIDLETKQVGIDYKTTGYFSRNIKLNPEWKLQQGIYQLETGKPSEIHVITRSKKDPVIVPDGTDHLLYFKQIDPEYVQKIIRDSYKEMNWLYEEYGAEQDWPGRPTHEWAGRYCGVENCCSLL